MTIPNPFARTRTDHARETAEDYVELIHRLERGGEVRTADLVRALGVSQPTVTKSLERLSREGWVEVEPRRGVRLTPAGERLARESRERHELVVRFLCHIGVSPVQAEVDAEGIEHHVSAETLTAMRRALGLDARRGSQTPSA